MLILAASLRAESGITIRKTIEIIIATFCILENHALLFSDKDFRPFVKHLGSRDVVRD